MPSTYRLDVSGPTSSRIRRLATGGERSAPGCGTTITTGRTPACTMNRPQMQRMARGMDNKRLRYEDLIEENGRPAAA